MGNDVTRKENSKLELVRALKKCLALETPEGRDDCISLLPETIRDVVKRRSDKTNALLNIVVTCLNYTEGIDSLVEAVHELEGESPSMKRVRDCADVLLREVMDANNSSASDAGTSQAAVRMGSGAPSAAERSPTVNDVRDSNENKLRIGTLIPAPATSAKPLGRRHFSSEDSEYILENIRGPLYEIECKRLHYVLSNPDGVSIDDYQEWLLSAKPKAEKAEWDMVLRDTGKRFMVRWELLGEKRRLSREESMYVLQDIWNPIYGPEAKSLFEILVGNEGFCREDFETWSRSANPEVDLAEWEIVRQKLKERFEVGWENAKPVMPPMAPYQRRSANV